MFCICTSVLASLISYRVNSRETMFGGQYLAFTGDSTARFTIRQSTLRSPGGHRAGLEPRRGCDTPHESATIISGLLRGKQTLRGDYAEKKCVVLFAGYEVPILWNLFSGKGETFMPRINFQVVLYISREMQLSPLRILLLCERKLYTESHTRGESI